MANSVIEIELIGGEQLKKLTSEGQSDKVVKALARALYEEALIIMAESQRRVPVDTGALRRSGRVLPPKMEGGDMVVELGYGGAASGYAMDQHENPNYRHTNGKTWKYLEGPVRERMPAIEKSLAARLDAILRGR